MQIFNKLDFLQKCCGVDNPAACIMRFANLSTPNFHEISHNLIAVTIRLHQAKIDFDDMPTEWFTVSVGNVTKQV